MGKARAATKPTARTKARAGGPRLAGRVAIVAGATRGAGRGIAWALGEAGATVYCTGRSVPGAPSPYGRPETIDETAALVSQAGGQGIAVRVDHTDEGEIAALMARVKREQGRLDLLVNSAAGEDPSLAWRTPFATLDADAIQMTLQRTVVSHLITARHAAPLLTRRTGLIIEVTEGDTLTLGGVSVVGCLVKTMQKVLAFVLAQELKKRQIAVIAVTPGFLRSESMLDHFKVTEATWRDGGKKDAHFLESETPRFLGRGIARLAAEPRVLDRSGALTSSWALSREFGVVDADGSRPDWGAHVADLGREFDWMRRGLETEVAWLTTIAERAAEYAMTR
jgi:NAD(P)-dependent dehydrogenase (short-subunit alcohol dehydrogenase family)